MTVSPAEAAKVARATAIQGVFPWLEEEIESQLKRLDNTIDSSIMNGKLTPELAQQYLIERNGYRKILRSFGQKVKAGQAVGEKTMPDLP